MRESLRHVAGGRDRVVLLVTGDGRKTPEPIGDLRPPLEIDADAEAVLDLLAA